MKAKVCLFMACVSFAASTVFSMSVEWSVSAVVTAYNVQVHIWENGSYVAQIFNLAMDNSSSGQSFTATASDPGFANFVTHLKNGVNGYVEITMTGVGNGDDASYGLLESQVFSSPLPENITGITMKVNTFTLVSPGLNENHNGQWTDGSWNITLLAVPEPNSILLFAVGLSILAVRRRPLRKCLPF